MKTSFIFLVLFFSSKLIFANTEIYDFAKYPEDSVSFKLVSEIVQTNKFAAKYKTLLGAEIKEGSNFAKKFRIAKIGCGAGCTMLGLIDCETGKVDDPKIYGTSLIPTPATAAFANAERVEFKLESKLLIFRGCLNEKRNQCGIHQYLLKNGKLKKLNFQAI